MVILDVPYFPAYVNDPDPFRNRNKSPGNKPEEGIKATDLMRTLPQETGKDYGLAYGLPVKGFEIDRRGSDHFRIGLNIQYTGRPLLETLWESRQKELVQVGRDFEQLKAEYSQGHEAKTLREIREKLETVHKMEGTARSQQAAAKGSVNQAILGDLDPSEFEGAHERAGREVMRAVTRKTFLQKKFADAEREYEAGWIKARDLWLFRRREVEKEKEAALEAGLMAGLTKRAAAIETARALQGEYSSSLFTRHPAPELPPSPGFPTREISPLLCGD